MGSDLLATWAVQTVDGCTKHTSQIMGYINLGNTEQQLRSLEEDDQSIANNVATHMLQFMVQGSVSLEYPVPHFKFATATLTAEQLYPMVWEVVGKLEASDLKVMVITADGASANRKFFLATSGPIRLKCL